MYLATQKLYIQTILSFPQDDFYLHHLQQLRIITAKWHQENMTKNALSCLASGEIWEGLQNEFISQNRLYFPSFKVYLENLYEMKKIHYGFKQNLSLLLSPNQILTTRCLALRSMQLNISIIPALNVFLTFFSHIPQKI